MTGKQTAFIKSTAVISTISNTSTLEIIDDKKLKKTISVSHISVTTVYGIFVSFKNNN